MATKKQKREAALKKREKFLAEDKRLGLAAQQRDRQIREEREQRHREEKARERRERSRSVKERFLYDLTTLIVMAKMFGRLPTEEEVESFVGELSH